MASLRVRETIRLGLFCTAANLHLQQSGAPFHTGHHVWSVAWANSSRSNHDNNARPFPGTTWRECRPEEWNNSFRDEWRTWGRRAYVTFQRHRTVIKILQKEGTVYSDFFDIRLSICLKTASVIENSGRTTVEFAGIKAVAKENGSLSVHIQRWQYRGDTWSWN